MSQQELLVLESCKNRQHCEDVVYVSSSLLWSVSRHAGSGHSMLDWRPNARQTGVSDGPLTLVTRRQGKQVDKEQVSGTGLVDC